IQRAADSRTWINEAGCAEVNMFEGKLGIKRALGSVSRIERPSLAIERHFAAAGHGCGERERHCAMGGNVVRYQIYILVNAFLPCQMAAAVAHAHSSVSNLKLIDRDIRRGFA